MKFLSAIFGLMLPMFVFNASSQISVDVQLDQNQFLPGESLPVTVRVTNLSGESLHLGADTNWLTFLVESKDGFVVIKKSDPPVQGAFDLGSSEVAIKHVDLAPYFTLNRDGRYKVTATVHIKNWGQDISSAPKEFDLIDGAVIWTQTFGVPNPGATNQPPDVRQYTLIEANYLRSQLRLYVQVSDESQLRILKVRAIGPMISFSDPQAQLDSAGNLHVLYQSGARAFTYSIVTPDGDIARQETYDYVNIRPRLRGDSNGDITVYGGVRRVTPDQMPVVKSPNELPAPAQ
jgi:hypothetical protein